MNHIGTAISGYISPDDTVLSLGCGVFAEIGGLNCKKLTGVDIYKPYEKAIGRGSDKVEFINGDITKMDFKDKSYDVVVAFDILEHLEKKDALKMLDKMRAIARKMIFILTPDSFFDNKTFNPTVSIKPVDMFKWMEENPVSPYRGFGYNDCLEHKCLITREEMECFDYWTSNRFKGYTFAMWVKH